MSKVKFNIKNVHVAPITAIDDNGLPTYDTPIAWKGAVSLSLDPAGESSIFYADGQAYVTTDGAVSYSGTLEMALVTNEIKKALFGYLEDDNKNLVETDSAVKECGLQFEMDDEEGNQTKFTLFRVKFARPSMTANTTEDQATINADSLSLTVSTVTTSAGKNVLKSYAEKGATNFDKYYDTVTLPTFATA